MTSNHTELQQLLNRINKEMPHAVLHRSYPNGAFSTSTFAKLRMVTETTYSRKGPKYKTHAKSVPTGKIYICDGEADGSGRSSLPKEHKRIVIDYLISNHPNLISILNP